MKRADIESKLCGFQCELKSRIEAAPIPSVVLGVLAGLILGLLPNLIIPALIIAAVVAGVLWLFAETDSLADSAAAANDEKNTTPGGNGRQF